MDRDEFLQAIEIRESQMKPYEGFVFVCGGPIDVTSPTPLSIRDALCRELAEHPAIEPRVRLAEDFKDWSSDSHYRDLVTFERHLAELSSVIVLVLESAGSIAELGFFSAIDAFQQKLMVVIESEHYRQQSFIRLGPVDFLEKVHANNVECHQWLTGSGASQRFDPTAAQQLQVEIVQAIAGRALGPAKERRIQVDLWLDRTLLVCELLNLCTALTSQEIASCFEQLACDVSDNEIRQTLFLLERVGLILMEPKGSQRFYVGVKSRRFVHFKFRSNQIDVDRFRVDQLIAYEKHDKRRFKAIQAARARSA